MDITGFITLIQNLSTIGYLVMFLIAFLEVTIFIGAFFPGQNLIIASGFIAQQEGFDLVSLMTVVFAGTFISNIAMYYLGKIYGDMLLLKYGKYFYFEEKHLRITKEYMKKHSGKTLIIGRFNSLIRSFIPFVAGTSEIDFWKFNFYNLIGTVLWTVVFVMIGYILGKSYEFAFGYIGAISIVSFIIVGVIFYWFLRKTYGKTVLE